MRNKTLPGLQPGHYIGNPFAQSNEFACISGILNRYTRISENLGVQKKKCFFISGCLQA
jgi:hypothetical protein